MKLIHFVLFILLFPHTSAQSIFKNEQKISHSKDLELEQISFTNLEEGIPLSGTLIYPKEGYEKIIIIVPGNEKKMHLYHSW